MDVLLRVRTVINFPSVKMSALGHQGRPNSRLKFRDDRNPLKADIVSRSSGRRRMFVILVTEEYDHVRQRKLPTA
jgi:hypothetical protein